MLLLAVAALALTGPVAGFPSTLLAGPNRCSCLCCVGDLDNPTCQTAGFDVSSWGECNARACKEQYEECASATEVDSVFHDCQCDCTNDGQRFVHSILVGSPNQCTVASCSEQLPTYCHESGVANAKTLDCDCSCCVGDDCDESDEFHTHTVAAGSAGACTPGLCRSSLGPLCPAEGGPGDVKAVFVDANLRPSPASSGGSSYQAELVVPDCLCQCDGQDFTVFTNGVAAACSEQMCRDVIDGCPASGGQVSAVYAVGAPGSFLSLTGGLKTVEVVVLTLGCVAILALITIAMIATIRHCKARRWKRFETGMVNVNIPDSASGPVKGLTVEMQP